MRTKRGRSADTNAEGGSIYDHIRRPPRALGLREGLAILRTAFGLVWSSARSEFVASAIGQVVGALAIAAQVVLTKWLVDSIADTEAGVDVSGESVWLLIGFVAAALLAQVTSSIQDDLGVLLSEKVGRTAASGVLEVAGRVDLEQFEDPSFFDRLQRARFSAEARTATVGRSVVGMLGAGLSVAAVLITLLTVAPLLVPLALLAAIPLWAAARRNSRDFHRFTHEMTSSDRERNHLWNALTDRDNAKEVRSLDIAGFLRTRHDELFHGRLQALGEVVRARLTRSILGNIGSAVLTGGALLVLILMIDRGWLTIGAAGAAVLGTLVLGQRMRVALLHIGRLYESALFVEDYSTFLDIEPDTRRAHVEVPTGFEKIEMKSVNFTYPGADRPVLHDVDLEIRRGEVVALVGENGSGKTTIAKLLAALYRPTAGVISWDGADIADWSPAELRRSITVVFQDFVRWYLPARWNIGLGRVEAIADEERIIRAASTAEAHGFLSSLPHGYDTVLSRLFAGGTDLSLGQWQRIALARAFFRDAPFVIMDEPTASLDPAAEHQIFSKVRSVLEGRTVLLISHRFSSVGLADRIYVLSEGAVVEHGTHDELMELDGQYAHLFRLQAAAYLKEPS